MIHTNVYFLKGENFSGRSQYLDIIQKENTPTSLLIKEIPVNNLSGIFPTVKEELQLHCTGKYPILESKIKDFLNSCGFETLLDQNPLLLSGGEQTLLTIVCNLLLHPKKLLIDTTVEQLNETWYIPLFDFITGNSDIIQEVIISDNRYKEYNLSNFQELVVVPKTETYQYLFSAPRKTSTTNTNNEQYKISLNNLSFGYKNLKVFNGFNYTFESSQIYHLKGRNGSGKSTLAKLLIGILRSEKNSILVNGKTYNPYTYPGNLVGYSFQNPDEQIFSNTIEQEVLPILKNESREYTQRRDLYLNMFGLENIKNYHPAEMPFVMRKRITLASTLAMDRPFYILDEPTLGQDDKFISFLGELIISLKEVGKGIILISHCKNLINKINANEICLSK